MHPLLWYGCISCTVWVFKWTQTGWRRSMLCGGPARGPVLHFSAGFFLVFPESGVSCHNLPQLFWRCSGLLEGQPNQKLLKMHFFPGLAVLFVVALIENQWRLAFYDSLNPFVFTDTEAESIFSWAMLCKWHSGFILNNQKKYCWSSKRAHLSCFYFCLLNIWCQCSRLQIQLSLVFVLFCFFCLFFFKNLIVIYVWMKFRFLMIAWLPLSQMFTDDKRKSQLFL